MDIPKYSKDKKVIFTESDHKYVDENANRLTSVTTLLHNYIPPFDPTGIITVNYAKKHNLTVDFVKAMWKEENLKSTIYGTAVHLLLEQYIADNILHEGEYKWIVEEFIKIPFQGKLHSEVLIHSLKHMVAGQVDIVEDLGDKTINIWDFKTNKELAKTDKYGGYMLKHCWFLEDCNYNHYTLQLSMYAYLCELKGLKINKLIILYINRDTKEMEQHEVKYRKKEVKKMLDNILALAA